MTDLLKIDTSIKISYSPYTLRGRGWFGDRNGALLRFDYSDVNTFGSGGSVGYSDCHPWTELGDVSLDQQLQFLKMGQFTHLTRRSFIHAMRDGDARKQGKNLFAECELIPKSHWLLRSWDDVIPDGITHVKIKVGRNPAEEIQNLRKFFDRSDRSNSEGYLKIRLDFNHRLNKDQFNYFMSQLVALKDKDNDNDIVSYIDFFEDPFPFNEFEWKEAEERWRIPLMLDYVSVPTFYKHRVIKPAVDDCLDRQGYDRIIVTSYLDHPVGQLAAALEASNICDSREICGLISHEVYESNSFSERLSQKGGQLKVPSEAEVEGTGIGFDDLFEKMKWKEL